MATKGHVIFGMPPSYTRSCDMPALADNPHIGGHNFQSKWGRISKNQDSITDTRLYPVTFTVGKPISSLTIANAVKGLAESATGEAKNRMTANGLKTFEFGSALKDGKNQYIENVLMLLEMLSYGEATAGVPTSKNSFLKPEITKIGTNFNFNTRYPKVTLMASEETTITESIQNEVAASLIEGIIGAGNKLGRELNFIKGTSKSVSDSAEELINKGKEFGDSAGNPLASMGAGLLGGVKNWAEGIVGKDIVESVITGNQIMLPKVWQQSSFVKTYTIQVRLFAPYAHRYSLAKNLFVPLAYIFGFSLPSQPTNSTIGSPLIVRVDSPGAFNIPLGVVTNVSLKKGGKLDLWTRNGQIRALDVTIEVADLYDKLPIPLKKLYDEGGDDSNIRNYMASLVLGSIPDERSEMEKNRKMSIARNAGPSFKKTWTFAKIGRDIFDDLTGWTGLNDRVERREQEKYEATQTDLNAISTATSKVYEWMKLSHTKVGFDTGKSGEYQAIQDKLLDLQERVGKKGENKNQLAEEYAKVYEELYKFRTDPTTTGWTNESADAVDQQLTMLNKASSQMHGLNEDEKAGLITSKTPTADMLSKMGGAMKSSESQFTYNLR